MLWLSNFIPNVMAKIVRPSAVTAFFSKAHWRILAALLAVLAILAPSIFAGPSTLSGKEVIASKESETSASPSVNPVDDAAASRGHALALLKNGTSTGKITNQVVTTHLVVRARGTPCGGSPRAVVSVDGKRIGSIAITSDQYADYTLPAIIPAGTHKLSVTYANDYAQRKCDRNLYLDKVDAFAEPTSTANPSTSTSVSSSPVPSPRVTPPLESVVPLPLPVTGTTYYVSPSGSNSNAGTSPSTPWRTVAKVNQALLNPGDAVLFEGSQTFSDTTLMPSRSGSNGQPITFSSYGNGRATLAQGIWFASTNWLTFHYLASGDGIQGSASGSGSNYITITNSTFNNTDIGVNSSHMANTNWTISGNTVDNIGDSGMILLGDQFAISGNTITNTGLDSSITYGKHGIYLKVTNAIITGNTIRHWVGGSAVSVRYRNSVIEDNNFSDGAIGISWFQYDPVAGTSSWRNNTISATTSAGIYVSGSDDAGNTRESFVITDNTLSKTSGQYLDLRPTSGTYTVCCNTFQ